MTTTMINKRLISNLVKLFNMYNLWDSIKDLSIAKDLFEKARLWNWKHKVGLMSTMIREPEYGTKLLVQLMRMKDRLAASDAYQAAGYLGSKATKSGLQQDYIGRIMCGLEVPADPDDLKKFILTDTPDKTPSEASKIYEETSFRMDPEVILQESIELLQHREKLRTLYEDASRKVPDEAPDEAIAKLSRREQARIKTAIDIWKQAQEELDAAEKELENTEWLAYLADLLIKTILNARSEDKDDLPEKALMIRYSCLEQYDSMTEFTEAISNALDSRIKEYSLAHPEAPATLAMLARAAKETSFTLSLFPAEEASSGSLWDKTTEKKERRKYVKLYKETNGFYGKNVSLTVIHRPIVMLGMNLEKG